MRGANPRPCYNTYPTHEQCADNKFRQQGHGFRLQTAAAQFSRTFGTDSAQHDSVSREFYNRNSYPLLKLITAEVIDGKDMQIFAVEL